MPQLCTHLAVAASTDSRWGPSRQGICGAWRAGGGCTVQPQARDALPTLHPVQRSDRETATS